jgi:hypothetical protein
MAGELDATAGRVDFLAHVVLNFFRSWLILMTCCWGKHFFTIEQYTFFLREL